MNKTKVGRIAAAFEAKYRGVVLTGEDALLDAYSADFIRECVGEDDCTYAELAEGGRVYCERHGHPTGWCDHIQSGNARRSDFNNPQPWVDLVAAEEIEGLTGKE